MSPGLFAAVVSGAILFGGISLVALALWWMRSRSESRLQRRLDPHGAAGDEFSEAGGGEFVQAVASQGKKLEALVDTSNESARLLLQAGWRTPQQRVAYYASQLLAPVALGGAAFLLWLAAPAKLGQPVMLLLFLMISVMTGLLVPRMVLRSTAQRRVLRIKREVPLFIHLLVLLFEAGLSTRQAFASLVRDGSGVLPELGREFELMLRQMEAGGDTAELLDNLAKAIDLEDLGNILALLRQVDRYGGEVREPLLEALKVIEDRRSLDMREMVNLMSGRMTVVMVMFFFPALIIFTAAPAFLSILTALGEVAG